MSHYGPGTPEGDLLIAEAIAGTAQDEVAKQLGYYLDDLGYETVIATDGVARRVTVDLYGDSSKRLTLPVIGSMPAVGEQVQVHQLPRGRSYAVPARSLGAVEHPSGDNHVGLVTTEAFEQHAEGGHLEVYNTPNTVGLYDGQWSQIAEGSLQRFGDVSGIVMVGGNGPYTAGAPRGLFRFHISQPDALGSAPLVSLELVDGSVIAAADLVLVTTAVNTSETEYQIHARVTGRDRVLFFLPLILHQHHAQHEWLACSPFAVSLPAGTQYAATAVSGGGGGGAPTGAGYLVTAAHADLSAEMVVGASPGGELGGTWASPSVDATHSGSAHSAFAPLAGATFTGAVNVSSGTLRKGGQDVAVIRQQPATREPVAASFDTVTAAAGTWYRAATASYHETFTVDFVGQVFLIIPNYSISIQAGAVNVMAVAVHIRDDTSPPATQANTAGGNDIAAPAEHPMESLSTTLPGGTHVYVATSVGTKHIYAYVKTSGAAGTVRLVGANRLTILPWPGIQ